LLAAALSLSLGSGAPAKRPHPATEKECAACHNGEARLTAKHFGQPVSKSACTRCHDVRAPAPPYLITAHVHGPYAGRHCDECHGPPRAGRATVTAGRVSELCFSCHVQLKNRLEGSGSVHNLLAKGECTSCHDPHASEYGKQLRRPIDSLCAPCHGSVPAAPFTH